MGSGTQMVPPGGIDQAILTSILSETTDSFIDIAALKHSADVSSPASTLYDIQALLLERSCGEKKATVGESSMGSLGSSSLMGNVRNALTPGQSTGTYGSMNSAGIYFAPAAVPGVVGTVVDAGGDGGGQDAVCLSARVRVVYSGDIVAHMAV